MKKNKRYLCFLCVLVLALAMTGCGGDDSSSEDFSYSDGIDKNGYWEGITAKDYVELAEYTGIKIPKDEYIATEGAVQNEIDAILSENMSTNEIKDRAVKDGETVNIDYVGRVDGEEFSGGSTEGAGTEITLGEAGYVDDFEDQIVGHTPGETFDVKVTFLDDYDSEDLQGKDAVFETTLNFIVEEVTPELTDKFVKENLEESDGWTTVKEMKDGVKKELEDNSIRTFISEYLLENFTVSSVPDSLIKYQENALIQYYKEMASSYSMEISDMITQMGYETTDDLIEAEADNSESSAKYSLIIQAIAEDLEIVITEDDLKTYFKENMGSDDYSQYEESYGLPYLKQSVMNDHVMEYIKKECILES